jgi:hypothetical protein
MAALIATEETDPPAAEIVSKATLRVYESGGQGLAQFQAGPSIRMYFIHPLISDRHRTNQSMTDS